MERRHDDDHGDPHRSLIFYVSDPLVRAWGWIFLVGLGGLVSAAMSLFGTLSLVSRQLSREHEPFASLLMIFALGSAAFSAWVAILLCQAALALRRTRDSVDVEDFLRSQSKLRVYFIVQGVLMLLGMVIAGLVFLFVGLDAMFDL